MAAPMVDLMAGRLGERKVETLEAQKVGWMAGKWEVHLAEMMAAKSVNY